MRARRICVVSFGTEGDMRPQTALARGLADRGHQVSVVGDISGAGTVVSQGLEFVPLTGSMRELLAPGNDAGRIVSDGANLLRLDRSIRAFAREHTPDWLQILLDVPADVVLYSGVASYIGRTAAEVRGLSFAYAGPVPAVSTREFPSTVIPVDRVPSVVPRAWANRISHLLMERGLWSFFKRPTNHARKSVGLPRMPFGWQGTAIFGCSPTLVPRPADWPDWAHAVGCWQLPGDDFTPPPALADFLDAGDKPVYVGFGSMRGFDSDSLRDRVVSGLAGQRALLAPGWSGMSTTDLPDNVHVLDPTPHTWLFPRCSVVVHHAGAGTSHAAAAAGVPSVPVPFAADQPFWAGRLRGVGVATPPLPPASFSAHQLSRSIKLAAGLRPRAAQVAAQMAAEDGVGEAIRRLDVALR